MKISKLHIDQFRHLENLDFDFTYPEDFHIEEKRGKPLKKICFIGQSATGKTGLLELIYENLKFAIELKTIENKYLTNNNLEPSYKIEFEIKLKNRDFIFENNEVIYGNTKYINNKSGGLTNKFLISENEIKNVFYFKANFISDNNIEIFTKNPIDLLEKYRDEILNIKNKPLNYKILFDDNVKPEIWLYLLNDILLYRKNFTQIMTELVHKGYINNAERFRSEYEKWQKENPNALESFAKEFNPLLEKLNLEVDLVNTEFSIPIKNKRTDEIIPIQDTSTGTKGLLLSFLPLFKLDTKDSIILIDEPERSLYPDMQMNLMDHYQRLAPDAQFIVATHSPFIAASFEPDERFILYFDEKGKVAVRRGTSPIGDDPNDILKNDFGLEFLMNEKGIKAFERYRDLKKRIASEDNEVEKDKLLEEILSLANAYKF